MRKNNQLFGKNLELSVAKNAVKMGYEAALKVKSLIKDLLRKKDFITIVFAAAPSQISFLNSLCENNDIEWHRIHVFHLDEYINLPEYSEQSFSSFLDKNIFLKKNFLSINYLNGNNPDLESECARYSRLIRDCDIDIACIGIGENCHIAFNDPHVADFHDPLYTKVVKLDDVCRQQQVNDLCFDSIDKVPKYALTMTIPAIMSSRNIFCMVPGIRKAVAVYNTIYKPICEDYPSTVLRHHARIRIFADLDSASKLDWV